MKAVVMAGGEGTRLRPLTSNQPKPMVPIAGKPCMEHIVELLRSHGLTDVVVTLAFMPQAIRAAFGEGEELGVRIDYSVEASPLGTAGSVKLAEQHLDETFVVISGDALTDVDLTALIASHHAHGAAVTIGLRSVENPLEFGIVVTDEDGRIERFLEKPSWGQVFSDTINTGIYVMEPEVLRHVPADRPFDFSKELFPLLLEMGRPLYGHLLDGYWQDIGTLEQYRQANFDALEGRVALDIAGIRLRGNVWVARDVDIDDLDPVEGPAYIGPNCRVARGATVGAHTVLSQGVTVREGARVHHSVVDTGTYIGRNAVVEGAILGSHCDIRDHARLHEGVALGDRVTVGREAILFPGVRVYPHKEIETGALIHESVVFESRTPRGPLGPEGAVGRVNVDLTPDVAVRLATALGTALRRGDRVVASRDSSDACRMIQRALIAGLTATGIGVADLRVSPAAVTRHVLKTQGLGAGVHVSRSAEDPELVQVRIFEAPGIQMTGALRREVEKHFSRHEVRRVTSDEVGETTYPARVRETYAQDILDSLDVDRIRSLGFRVGLDYGGSAAIYTLPLLLGPLGVEAVAIHGSVERDALAAAQLDPADARRIVQGMGADLGVVLDRAAERLRLVDEHGVPLDHDTTLLLAIRLLAGAGRVGALAVPVTATALVEAVVGDAALEVRRTRHSLAALTSTAAQPGVLFAGAPTGGLVFPHIVPGYDAVGSLCSLLELLALDGRTVSQVVAELPVPTMRTARIDCPWNRKGTVMRVLHEQLADRELDLLDGVKARDERGAIHVIPDPQEPVVLAFAEGTTQARSEELLTEVSELVEAIVQGDDAERRTLEQASSSG